MAATLTLSSKLSPFPYAAASIAAFTEKAELLYDEATSGPVLELNGSKITAEEDIVQALARAGGLSDDSAKVRIVSSNMIVFSHPDRLPLSLHWRNLSHPRQLYRMSSKL